MARYLHARVKFSLPKMKERDCEGLANNAQNTFNFRRRFSRVFAAVIDNSATITGFDERSSTRRHLNFKKFPVLFEAFAVAIRGFAGGLVGATQFIQSIPEKKR